MQKDYNFEVPSLISRDASTAIKGLLMLLVVFGHTGLLTTDFLTGERTFFYKWLYTFHVYIFFILPFIYGYKRKPGAVNGGQIINIQQITKDVKHVVIKIGVPYCWFYLFSAIIFVVVGAGKIDLGGMLYAFVFGNEFLMNKYIGFDFMWFLPAMLVLMSLKSVWYNSKQIIRNTIIVISFLLWCLTIFKILQQSFVGLFVPFAITQALYYIIWGLTIRWVLEKQLPAKWQMLVVILLIGICLVLLYYNNELSGPNLNVRKIVQLFMPILAFFFLYEIKNLLSKSKVLKFIGTYSLQIYLYMFMCSIFFLPSSYILLNKV